MKLPALIFIVAIALTGLMTQNTSPQHSSLSTLHSSLNTVPPDEQAYLNRFYPDAAPNYEAISRILHDAQTQEALRTGGIAGFGEAWTVEGPGNIGARINTVAVHPTNPNIMYVGFARGGVWKTTNGGTSWAPIFDQQLFGTTSDIVIAPSDPNTIYVCTGDHNISAQFFIGDGLYKSTDGGQTWANIGLGNTYVISKLIVHPTNPNILYACSMGNPATRDNNRGLYKSTNGGATWTQSLFVDIDAGVIDMVMDPVNPQIIYAASWNRTRTNLESIIAGPDAKIWKTTNGGNTWTALSGGLPTGDFSRIGLATSGTNTGVVYAVYLYPNSDFYELYKTTDGGNSWNPIPTVATGLDPGIYAGFGWYFAQVRVNPTNDNEIHLLGVDMYSTFDGGASWAMSTPPWYFYSVHADKHDLAFASNGDWILGTDGGLYRSTDEGVTWFDIESIPTTQFYRVAYNPHEPTNYYGGAQDNGTTKGNASGINLWPRLFGGDGFQAAFRNDDPLVAYYETQNGNISVTTDGFNFQSATDGLPGGERRNWDMQYIISHFDPNVLYTGMAMVYKSVSGAVPYWYNISPVLTDSVLYRPSAHVISAIDESPIDDQILYAGTSDGNVWRTLDGGNNWDSIHSTLPDRYVSSVHASPDDAGTVFVTFSGYKDNDYLPHVFRSDDNGSNWVNISGDLPDFSVNDILIMSGFNNELLFVATDLGLYGTIDGGTHWERVGTGMPWVSVFDLDYNPTTRRIVAGTFARSIMTYPLDPLMIALGAEGITQKPTALKVFPNIDAYAVNVEFTSPSVGDTDIMVYDVNGRLVSSMKHATSTGNNRAMLDISALGTGQYYVRVGMFGTGRFMKM